MKQYYEAHVTFTGDKAALEAKTKELKWKFSAIDGDSNLGDGVKLYATRQMNVKWGEEGVIDWLTVVAKELEEEGATILRRKLELVIYDDRVGLVTCNGACPECVN